MRSKVQYFTDFQVCLSSVSNFAERRTNSETENHINTSKKYENECIIGEGFLNYNGEREIEKEHTGFSGNINLVDQEPSASIYLNQSNVESTAPKHSKSVASLELVDSKCTEKNSVIPKRRKTIEIGNYFRSNTSGAPKNLNFDKESNSFSSTTNLYDRKTKTTQENRKKLPSPKFESKTRGRFSFRNSGNSKVNMSTNDSWTSKSKNHHVSNLEQDDGTVKENLHDKTELDGGNKSDVEMDDKEMSMLSTQMLQGMRKQTANKSGNSSRNHTTKINPENNQKRNKPDISIEVENCNSTLIKNLSDTFKHKPLFAGTSTPMLNKVDIVTQGSCTGNKSKNTSDISAEKMSPKILDRKLSSSTPLIIAKMPKREKVEPSSPVLFEETGDDEFKEYFVTLENMNECSGDSSINISKDSLGHENNFFPSEIEKCNLTENPDPLKAEAIARKESNLTNQQVLNIRQVKENTSNSSCEVVEGEEPVNKDLSQKPSKKKALGIRRSKRASVGKKRRNVRNASTEKLKTWSEDSHIEKEGPKLSSKVCCSINFCFYEAVKLPLE